MSSNFNFEEQKEQSAIKTEIVTKYFNAWATILVKHFQKIAYVDLFAGPGIYEDGNKSTPIIITEKVIKNSEFAKKTLLYFNEMNPEYYQRLVTSVSQLDGINSLTFSPIFHKKEVTYETPKEFSNAKIPCFCFLDPSGYKGLSLNLISAFGKDSGTDVIFFFNYNDINRAITNSKVLSEMLELFGEKHYKLLLKKIQNQHGQNRESIVVNEMAEAIRDIGIPHLLPFRFKFAGQERTSHYLIFASKNKTAFSIMKDIMYSIGEKDFNNIGKFEFIPSCDKEHFQQLSIIDLFTTTFEDFKRYLCEQYHGKSMSVKNLIEQDITNTKFVRSQYKDALKQLEAEGKIYCNSHKKNSMGDNVFVIFQ
ncbi:MAG: three-Cys-motif partner protein TcmP [Lachnospiraceae bacterium]|nr:three-Cys-motif partner protein TcmP [Lachnospiraceae bacterium]